MTKRNALRTVLSLLTIAALAGSAGVSHAQPLAPVDSTGQTPDQPAVRQQTMFPAMGNSPIVRMSSRQTSATAEGIVQNGRLVRMMTPLYPPAAVEAHISGVVTIEARIGKDGRIIRADVVSGPLALRRGAQYAVKRGRGEPTPLDGASL